MRKKVIISPVDGATNIKLEVLDFETLETLFSESTDTPRTEINGLEYNCTGDECAWFDQVIKKLPADLKAAAVIAPVARGASGGLVSKDDCLIEEPGKAVTLAYTHNYPEEVEKKFEELAGSEEEYFLETGSVRSFPGSIGLMKRFLFEEMVRSELLEKAGGFLYYGCLMAGHFLGKGFMQAWEKCGNEHSYWMCHTGARNINGKPGTLSSLAGKISSFRKLVPKDPAVAYKPIGIVPHEMAADLGLPEDVQVIPGGHDTCLSHIPVMSTFYQAFPDRAGKPVIHVDAGTWTMVAQIGGRVQLPPDGYKKGLVVQGTVDGEPVVTAMYAGGNDYKFAKALVEKQGLKFGGGLNEKLLLECLSQSDCMVLPNIHPDNVGTGPWPDIKGSVVNEEAFYQDGEKAAILANMATIIATVINIDSIATDPDAPVVLTAGGSRDPYFGRLIATMTGRKVYSMKDKEGKAVTETTTLGAAIAGKAAVLGTHPYKVDMTGLGVSYEERAPFSDEIRQAADTYKAALLKTIKA